jgi:hypothetical protein
MANRPRIPIPRRTPRTRPVQRTSAKGVGELAPGVLAPVIGKRVGLDVNLRMAWPDVVGEKVASCTQVLRIDWPRRTGEDDPFKPGTLVLACEPSRALFIEADSTVLRGRINVFLGFQAIGKLKFEQRAGANGLKSPVKAPKQRLKPNSAQVEREREKLNDLPEGPVRDAFARLGAAVKLASAGNAGKKDSGS